MILTTLDQMLAAHEADRCDCATCDQVRALMVEMASGDGAINCARARRGE